MRRIRARRVWFRQCCTARPSVHRPRPRRRGTATTLPAPARSRAASGSCVRPCPDLPSLESGGVLGAVVLDVGGPVIAVLSAPGARGRSPDLHPVVDLGTAPAHPLAL